MKIIKDENSAFLDIAMTQADELVELFTRLAPSLGDENREILLAAARRHADILERLRANRRGHDDLPAAGDPERAELQAMVTSVQGFFSSLLDSDDDESGTQTEALLLASRASCGAFDEIPENVLTDGQQRLVDEYCSSCRALVARLA